MNKMKTVLLFRPSWEGGQYEGDETKRQDALRLAMQLGATYVDIELQVINILSVCSLLSQIFNMLTV